MQLMQRRCSFDRMNVERLAARLFVAGGGALWVFASLGGTHWRGFADLGIENYLNSLVPLAITVIVFALGLFYEVLASALLLALAAGTVAWGVIAGWEPGVWVTVSAVMILPLLVAAALYIAAARMQQACEYSEAAAKA